jgi:FO synthase
VPSSSEMSFVHHNAPIYLAGAARPGSTEQENRALHAVARLLLHGLIPNIQCSWVKLGNDGCRKVLQGGANDVGSTLMEETISRMADSPHGSYKTISDIEAMVAPMGRPVRQRTTTYGAVPAERRAAALASNGVCASIQKRPVAHPLTLGRRLAARADLLGRRHRNAQIRQRAG